MAEDVDLALLGLVAEGLGEPIGGAFEGPGDGVPIAQGVVVPEQEVVGVDLELGGRDNPVGCGVGLVDGIDGRWVGGVFEPDVHGDDAVATGMVKVGPVVGSGVGVGQVRMVGLDDLVSSGVPIVAVAVLAVGYGELAVLDGAEAKVELDDAVAALLCLHGVGVGSRGAELLPEEGVGVALAEIVRDVGLEDLHLFEVQVDDAVAAVLRLEGVVVDAFGGEALSEEVV